MSRNVRKLEEFIEESTETSNGGLKKKKLDDFDEFSREIDDLLEPQIIKQVEYYFSDINLLKDKFLVSNMEEDGWVLLTTMLKFNRLRQLSKDPEKIASALKRSKFMDVSTDGDKIRRKLEFTLPEDTKKFWNEVKSRTVYVEGFPPETTMYELIDFAKFYGNMESVFKRYGPFTGSAYITFVDQESAQKFVENPFSKSFKNSALVKMMRLDYEMKQQEEKLKSRSKKPSFIPGRYLRLYGLPSEEYNSRDKWKECYESLFNFLQTFGPVKKLHFHENIPAVTVRFKSNDNFIAHRFWETCLASSPSQDGTIIFDSIPLTAKVLNEPDDVKECHALLKGPLPFNDTSKTPVEPQNEADKKPKKKKKKPSKNYIFVAVEGVPVELLDKYEPAKEVRTKLKEMMLRQYGKKCFPVVLENAEKTQPQLFLKYNNLGAVTEVFEKLRSEFLTGFMPFECYQLQMRVLTPEESKQVQENQKFWRWADKPKHTKGSTEEVQEDVQDVDPKDEESEKDDAQEDMQADE